VSLVTAGLLGVIEAASAAARRSVTSLPAAPRAATPTETVRLTKVPACAIISGTDIPATCARSRSAMLSASASSVWGSKTTNSSPRISRPVVIAQLLAERVAQRTQDLVPTVTVGIVDGLEMIDVNQRDRQWAAGPHRTGDLGRRLALPVAALSSPVLVSILDLATSWSCIMNRLASST